MFDIISDWQEVRLSRPLTKTLTTLYITISTILSELETNSARLLLFISTTTLAKTFIANFGFVKRNLLIKTGGFIDFPGCVYEDDHLMFKLFLLDKKYLLLDNLTVIHVNHPIKVKEERNVAYYFRELVKQGYYWFNIINIFEKKNEKLKILEPLKSIHFDYKIKQIIESFSEFLPINLSNVSAKEKIYWQKNNLPSDIQIVRLIKELCNSKNLGLLAMMIIQALNLLMIFGRGQ